MALIRLSKTDKYVIVDDSDYESLKRYSWHLHNQGYAQAWSKGSALSRTRYLMHRLLINPPKTMDIDHINGNKLDNRRDNLRVVKRSVNASNSKFRSNNKSGYRGVHWDNTHELWVSKIRINGERKLLGYFKNKLEAARAYNTASSRAFGNYAKVNEL